MLEWQTNIAGASKKYMRYKNIAGSTLYNGDVVILTGEDNVTTTTHPDHGATIGVVIHQIADDDWGWAQTAGYHEKVKLTHARGTITPGENIGTSTVATRAGKGAGLGTYVGTTNITAATTGKCFLNAWTGVDADRILTGATTIMSASGSITISATSGDISFMAGSSGASGADINMQAASSITLSSSELLLYATSGFLFVTPVFNLNVGDFNLTASGSISAQANLGIEIECTGGTVDIIASSAAGDVEIIAGSGINISANVDDVNIDAGLDFNLTAKDNISAVATGGTIEIEATQNDIHINAPSAVGDIKLEAGSAIQMSAAADVFSVYAGTNLTLDARDNISANSVSGVIEIEATQSDILVTAPSAAGDIDLRAGSAITLSAGVDINLQADANISAEATDSIEIQATQSDIMITAPSAAGDVTIQAGNDITLTGDSVSAIAAGNGFHVHATGGITMSAYSNVSMDAIGTGAVVSITGGSGITLQGTTDDVNINAAVDVHLSAGNDISAEAVNLSGQFGGAVALRSNVYQNETLSYLVSASGGINISENASASDLTIQLTGAGASGSNIILRTNAASGSDIRLNASGGSGDIEGYAGRNLSISAGSAARLSAANDVTVEAGSAVTMSAATDVFVAYAGTNLQLNARDNISANSVSGAIEIGATRGNILITAPSAKADIDIRAGSAITLSATSGGTFVSDIGMEIAGSAVVVSAATTDLTLAAEDEISARAAGDITIYETASANNVNLGLAGAGASAGTVRITTNAAGSGNIRLLASGSIGDINGYAARNIRLSAGSAVRLSAATDITVEAGVDFNLTAKDNISAVATGGAIEIEATQADILVVAPSAKADIGVRAGSAITLSAASGGIFVSDTSMEIAGSATTVSAATVALTLFAETDINATAKGAISAVATGGAIEIEATQDNILVVAPSAKADIDVRAGSAITLSAASGGIFVSDTSMEIAGSATTVSAGTVDLTLYGNDQIDMTAPGGIQVHDAFIIDEGSATIANNASATITTTDPSFIVYTTVGTGNHLISAVAPTGGWQIWIANEGANAVSFYQSGATSAAVAAGANAMFMYSETDAAWVQFI